MNGRLMINATTDDGIARYSDRVVGNLHLGAVAQLGEHHNGIVGVKGSSPFSSTKTETGRSKHGRSLCSDNQGGTAENPSSLTRRGVFYLNRVFLPLIIPALSLFSIPNSEFHTLDSFYTITR